MPRRHSGSAKLPDLAAGGVVTLVEPEIPYVWPDVTIGDTSENTESPIVLIAAPGAMGKSAAAKNIAAELKAIYIDLALLRVGSGSLTGELTKALGFKEAGEFVGELKTGQAAIVLDSTDEAQLGAGRENYLAFLGDLWWLLSDATMSSQVVLLGRNDATDTTLLGLMDMDINPPLYQIAPLSHPQACELVDLTLDNRERGDGPYVIHRQHPIPFGEMRDSLFEGIALALNTEKPHLPANYWEDVSDFLGYPPVLLALAERLAVDNPSAEAHSNFPAGQHLQRGELLQSILESILDREQGKVRARVGDSLGMHPDSPERNVLYGRDEQVSRLLALTGTVGVTLDVPASLDEADRLRYEENIAGFLTDHPFLKAGHFANIVFQDYVRAWAVSSDLSEMYSSARPEFLATLPLAGPFFAHFLHALSSHSGGLGVVPEDLVHDAIYSYALGTTKSSSVYLHRGELAALVLHTDLDEQESLSLTFEVTEVSGILILRSPIARATVITDYAVILRGQDGNLDLGPNVSIVAAELELAAKSLTVLGTARGGEGSFSLISAGSVVHDADLKVGTLADANLAVNWADAWHQWKPYLEDFDVQGSRLSRPVTSQVLLSLRRILTSFRPSVQAAPSVSADKMDRVLVGTNPVFQATLAALIDLGIVSRDNSLYNLHLDQLGSYSISWTTLRGDDPVGSLKSIFAAVSSSGVFDTFR